ncbi:hypothetical protein NEPAR04_1901 [Nematocida parisii]|nr:hypothetical protein NEPAR03_1845 [Nematocida parisii]KAI5130732.1 hypothetical protein NEPAR08_2197 [Nematocida parisii]KAI5143574.1 hypothetical protein NEPAR04_1901 [Nematocida parisii]
MFIRPTTRINEEKFCEVYKKLDKRFNDTLDYNSAVKMVYINSEEYKAYDILKRSLTFMNYHEQLDITTEVIENNPNSLCAWEYRMYLIKNKKIVKKGKDEKDKNEGKASNDKKDVKDSKDSKDKKDVKDSKDEEDSNDKNEVKNEKHGRDKTEGKDGLDGVDEMDGIDSKNIQFIKKVLHANNRNLHAWMHISELYNYSDRIIENEISKCISNYSAYFATIQNNTYMNIEHDDLKNIVYTDPEISSPWVFIRMVEVCKRFNRMNSYVIAFDDRIEIILKTPCKTKVYLEYGGKVVEYSVDLKKVFPIYFSENGFGFNDITSFVIKTKNYPSIKIDVKKPYTPDTPKFIDEFISKHSNVNSLVTKLYFVFDESERSKIVSKILGIDPNKQQMYLEMKRGFTVYSGIEM